MLASAALYLGLIIAVIGFGLFVMPARWLRISKRNRATAMAGAGILMSVIALIFPASESRAGQVRTRLDEVMPVWQFREFHTIKIAAPPDRVFEAIKRVRPDEIFLFRTLIAIRGGGRPLPQTVIDAAKHFESILDIATHTTFVYLADDRPREFVVGTVVGRPAGIRRRITPELFQKPLPPGFALATMNYVVTPDGSGSLVSTETRVFANSPSAVRRFAVYWRFIYPGSAIIRRMSLRAVERRATSHGR